MTWLEQFGTPKAFVYPSGVDAKRGDHFLQAVTNPANFLEPR